PSSRAQSPALSSCSRYGTFPSVLFLDDVSPQARIRTRTTFTSFESFEQAFCSLPPVRWSSRVLKRWRIFGKPGIDESRSLPLGELGEQSPEPFAEADRGRA